MKNPSTSVIYIFLLYFLGPLKMLKFGNALTYDSGTEQENSNARFISFDSNGKKVKIDLDLSIPFISIPLSNKDNKYGRPMPLVTLDIQGIAILGILVATTAFIVPLFSKNGPSNLHYRIDKELQGRNVGHAVNDVFLNKSYVTPCVQSILCSLVMKIKRSENLTSTEKIIDGLVRPNWFHHFCKDNHTLDVFTNFQAFDKECVNKFRSWPETRKMIYDTLKTLGIV